MPYAEELEKEKEGDTSIGVQSLTAHDDKSSLADNIPGKKITYLTSYLFVASKRRPFMYILPYIFSIYISSPILTYFYVSIQLP